MKTFLIAILFAAATISVSNAEAQTAQEAQINHMVDRVFASYLVEDLVKELSEELPLVPQEAIKKAVVTAYTDAEDRESFFRYLESELRLIGVTVE